MNKNKSLIIVFICVMLFHMILCNNINSFGKKYYPHPIHIYDLGFDYLPNLNKFAYISDIIVVLSCLFLPGIFTKFIYLIIPIFLIRAITIHLTLLPSVENCHIPSVIYSKFFGGCYDKIFSGHFAIVFLITLLLLEKSYISLYALTLINFLHGLFIIAVRNHYTIDIVVSFFVTLCVYLLFHKLT